MFFYVKFVILIWNLEIAFKIVCKCW